MFCRTSATDFEANTGCFSVFDDDALHVRIGYDSRVPALHGGIKKRARRADPAAFEDAALGVGDALLDTAVVIGIARNAKGFGTTDKRITQRVGFINVGDGKWTPGAMEAIVACPDFVLALLEIGQHVFVAPALVPHLSPAVKIETLATVVNVPVDRTRAAEGLAARVSDGASIQAGTAFSFVHPVERGILQRVENAGRNVDEWISVAWAGFQNTHFVFTALRQASSDNRTG